MTEALSDSGEFLEPVAHLVKTEDGNVVEVSPKGENRIKRYARAVQKTGSVCLSLRSESPPSDISYDKNNESAYSDTNTDEDEPTRQKRKTKIAAERKDKS